MTHYFLTPETTKQPREVRATIWDRDYVFSSANGVFSATRLDPGTQVLFRATQPPVNRPARLLDLGCGFGPIAVALADHCPLARVDAIDTNQRAIELTRDNAFRYGVADRVHACAPEEIDPATRYDEIWSNPPIRIGKPALHQLLTTWLRRLAPHGSANLVVSKNLGADSLSAWLTSHDWVVNRLGSAKGFRVLRVEAFSV